MYDKCTHVVWTASYFFRFWPNFDSVDKSHQYRVSQKSDRLEPSSMRIDKTDRTKLTVAFRNYLVNKPKTDVKEWDGKLWNNISHLLCDPSVHYRVHNSPLLLPILSHTYPINTDTPYFPSTPVLIFSSMFFHLKFSTLCHLSHACYIPHSLSLYLRCSQLLSLLTNIIRARWAGHVARTEQRRAHRLLEGMLKERDHLEDLWVDGRIWQCIVKKQYRAMKWFVLAQDRWRADVNTVMNLRITLKVGNFLTCRRTVSFSRRTLLYDVS